MSALKKLERTQGPSEDRDAKALEEEMGFGYREAFGELIYAYMAWRLEIDYAVAELFKFSSSPAKSRL